MSTETIQAILAQRADAVKEAAKQAAERAKQFAAQVAQKSVCAGACPTSDVALTKSERTG